MRTKVIGVVLTNFAILLPLEVFADSGGSGGEPMWQTFLVNVAPFVIFLALMYFIFIRQIKSGRQRANQYQARQQEHWERVEALLERLVVALESKNKS